MQASAHATGSKAAMSLSLSSDQMLDQAGFCVIAPRPRAGRNQIEKRGIQCDL